MGCNKGNSKRDVYSNTGYIRKEENYKQSKLIPKGTRIRRINKVQS